MSIIFLYRFCKGADEMAGKRLGGWSSGPKFSGSDGFYEFLDYLVVCSSMEFQTTGPLEVVFLMRHRRVIISDIYE